MIKAFNKTIQKLWSSLSKFCILELDLQFKTMEEMLNIYLLI